MDRVFIYEDGPFEHYPPDAPERDRDRAVTPDCDIIFPIIRTTICVNIPLGDPGGFLFCHLLVVK